MLLNTDLQNLIEIGKTNPTEIRNKKDLLEYFKSRDIINRLGRQEWKIKSLNLSDNDLILLFKGLVLIENELKWIGGSVAGAIWIYRVIIERNLDKDYEIADFGLRNCQNSYVPFGNSYYGIRTIQDYFFYMETKARRSYANYEHDEKILKRVKGRKGKRVITIANLRKLSYETRGKNRKDLKKKYSSKSKIEKLQIIANDDIYPPEYYPNEWIKMSPKEIKKLPIELIKKLYDKLSTKTKGEYKRFAKELQKHDDGI
jgi:hypothetical protein